MKNTFHKPTNHIMQHISICMCCAHIILHDSHNSEWHFPEMCSFSFLNQDTNWRHKFVLTYLLAEVLTCAFKFFIVYRRSDFLFRSLCKNLKIKLKIKRFTWWEKSMKMKIICICLACSPYRDKIIVVEFMSKHCHFRF
jgi:hypothetical protein